MWEIGVNTWVRTSPLTDDGPAVLAPTVREWEDRPTAYAELRENLAPVVEYAAANNVRIAVEPLNRYETSVLNTVEQALEVLRRGIRQRQTGRTTRRANHFNRRLTILIHRC